MTIAAKITALEVAHKLTRYVPRGRRPAKRRLYLANSGWKSLTDSSSAVNVLVGKGYVEAALARWTLGERVYGDTKKCRFLCRLCSPPPEVWEVRVTEPIAQARLLGRFAEPDTLILTSFHTRQLLGKRGSQNWMYAMKECERIWIELFDPLPPFRGAIIHDYVTENCDDFPI